MAPLGVNRLVYYSPFVDQVLSAVKENMLGMRCQMICYDVLSLWCVAYRTTCALKLELATKYIIPLQFMRVCVSSLMKHT